MRILLSMVLFSAVALGAGEDPGYVAETEIKAPKDSEVLTPILLVLREQRRRIHSPQLGKAEKALRKAIMALRKKEHEEESEK